MPERISLLYEHFNKWVWVFLVVLLPISSLPLVSRLTGADSVAAASGLPLLLLLVFWFIPYILKGGGVPKVSIGLIALVFVALISTAAASFLSMPSFKGDPILPHELVALFTLAIGACFYLVTASWPKDESHLRLTLQLINWSGFIMLLWSLLQGYYWLRVGAPPEWMKQVQSFVSLQGFYPRRVTGFAYEPSWQGHQLNMVYLPIWLAASLQGYSAHRFRFLRISLENVLFVMGFVVLVLASRVGLLSILLVVAYLVFKATQFMVKRSHTWLDRHISTQAAQLWAARVLFPAVLGVVFFAIYLAGAVGVVYVAGKNDYRLGRLFDPSIFSTNIYAYANQLSFAERVVYWGTGWEVFNDHPFLGVGIGNTGYYFPEKMPAFGWSLTEVNTVMYRASAIPNTKSLWVRILSETGIVGFAVWIAWLYLLWQAGRYLRSSDQKLLRTVGLAGALALIALFSEGFSIDSFALPYIWFSFGLLSAASRIQVKQPAQAIHPERLVVNVMGGV